MSEWMCVDLWDHVALRAFSNLLFTLLSPRYLALTWSVSWCWAMNSKLIDRNVFTLLMLSRILPVSSFSGRRRVINP